MGPHQHRQDAASSPTGHATISILQACEQAGVSRRTIYNWILLGKVTYVRTAGGRIRIFRDSLWKNADGYDSQESV